MPMGVTHRRINTVATVGLTGAALYIGWTPLQAGCLLVGASFATFFMNPDLDLHSIGYTSWGPLRFIWLPYQKIMGHRCWMSHFPVISTFIRIVYLLWLPSVIFLLLNAGVRSAIKDDVNAWFPLFAPYAMVFILGMIFSDTLHTILDISNTEIKNLFRGSRRGRRENFFEHHGQAGPRRRAYAPRPSRAVAYRRRY